MATPEELELLNRYKGSKQKPAPVAIDPLQPIFGGETPEAAAARRAKEAREARAGTLAEEAASRAAGEVIRDIEERTFQRGTKIADQYYSRKPIATFEAAWPAFTSAISQPKTTSGDRARIYNAIKILDPEGAVPTGDIEGIQSQSPIIQRLAREFGRILDQGGTLPDQQRIELEDALEQRVKTLRGPYDLIRSDFEAKLQRNNLDPLEIGSPIYSADQDIYQNWLKSREVVAPELRVATGAEYSTDADFKTRQDSAETWAATQGLPFDQALAKFNADMQAKGYGAAGPKTIEVLQLWEKKEPGNRGAAQWELPKTGVRKAEAPGRATALGSGLLTGGTAGLVEEAVGMFDPEAAAKLEAAKRYSRENYAGTELIGEAIGGFVSPLSRIGKGGTVIGEATRGATYGGLMGLGEPAAGADITERLKQGAIGLGIGGVTGGVAQRLLGGRVPTQAEIPPAGGVPEAPAGVMAPEAATVSAAAPGAPFVAPSAAAQQGISEDLIRLARASVGYGPSAKTAQKELRKAVDADPAIVQQAKDIGIELPADVFSANIQLQNLTGLARSQPGSAAQAAWQQNVANSAKQVQDSLADLDATTDLVGLSDRIYTRMNSAMEALETQGDELRKGIDASISKASPVEATNLQAIMADTINNLGGINKAREAMSSEELRLLKALGVGETPQQPTYSYLERMRRDIGKALGEKRGPWADVDTVALNDYYDALAKDRIAHVRSQLGDEAAERMTASNDIFKSMYAARKEMTDLFGRDLNKGIGGAIRSAIAQGGKGDAQNVRKLFSLIPEDMRSEAAISGILANATARGGEGGFSFSNFRNTYRALRDKNTTIYNELAKNMRPEQRKFLENLYGVSRRIADAETRIERTGRALSPVAKEINADTLTQKVIDRATTRGLGAIVGGVGGTAIGDVMVGAPLAVALEAGLSALSRGPATNLDRVSNLVGSAPYRELVDTIVSGGNTDKAINRVAGSRPFIDYIKSIGVEAKEGKNWLRSAMTVGPVSGVTRQGESQQPVAAPPMTVQQ